MQVAQVNIALSRAPVESAELAEFRALLDPLNAFADRADGFVWRLQTEDGDSTAIRGFDDARMIVNMSVWESIDQLADFVYRSGHVHAMRRRREWFERLATFMALWWVPVGHTPTVAEAERRLAYLREHGPTPYAFTFNARFTADEEAVESDSVDCFA